MTTPGAVQPTPETSNFPLMERPYVGILLAFAAGAMNAWSLANAATFSTVQSGNVISMGYWLVQGDWSKFWFPALAVLAFGLGSALCGVLMTTFQRSGRPYTPGVLLVGSVLLILLAVLAIVLVGSGDGRAAGVDLSADHSATAHWIALGISFIAGAQGNAFHKNRGMLYGNVAVTFVVQMAFNFLVQSAFKREGINGATNLKWAGLFFMVLLGFSAGAAAGFGADLIVNGASILIPAVVLLALFFAALAQGFRHVDPTPGGTFA
ncbi:MAG: YoaK family protein [Microbacterium sp.]